MSSWIVRQAATSDAEAMSICMAAAYAEYASRIEGIPTMTAADCLADIINSEVWIAEADDTIAGALVLAPHDDFMHLANVAVHPKHRGTGLGRALIKHSGSEALRQGYGELRLNTHLDIPENVRLYEHLGWERTGEKGNKVSMRKVLKRGIRSE